MAPLSQSDVAYPPGCAACATNPPKKTRKTFFVCPRLYVQAGGTQNEYRSSSRPRQQIVGLLLSTVPLAERMLLYNVLLAAWLMSPSAPSANKLCPCHH